jgi:hypothetical protein
MFISQTYGKIILHASDHKCITNTQFLFSQSEIRID